MILLLFFLSFWLGLTLSSAIIGLSITTIVFLFFILKRFKLKAFLLSSLFFLVGFSLSFVHVSYPRSSYQGFVHNCQENYFLFNSGGERLYVYSKGHHYDIGDFLTISGQKKELSFTKIESSFDFKDYLHKRGVYKELVPKNIKVNFHNPIRVHERREKLLSHLNDDTKSIVGGILFSESDDSEVSAHLRGLHLARFLSSSGLFISAFYRFFVLVLSRLMKDKYAEISAIGLLSLYTVFTFPLFSVIRVMLFLVIRWINTHLLKKKFSYLTLLSFLGLFFLIIDPYLAKQDCFILGFLIPLISYLTRNIYRGHKIKRWLIRFFIIYLFFLPFEMRYYHKIVILSLPFQIVFAPIFILIGVVSLLCFFYVPIYPLLDFLITILKGLSIFISPLSFGINVPELNDILTFIYFAIYVLWLVYLSRKFVPLYRFFLITLISGVILCALPINNYISNEVNFINVGQGDSTLIRSKNKTILIDTGGLTYMDVANDSLVPYLRKKRIYQIDAIFITHYDFDHYGALDGLRKAYSVKAVYDYTSLFPITIGNITFNNLNKYANSDEENDKSLVISFNLMQKDFLIMGDAPSYIEKEIIKNNSSVKCDILKVGHHGSNTSTCDAWLNYLKPKEAVISCGKNNKFGHPNKEVVSLLNKYQIKIRRTDIEGTIIYKKYTF